MSTTGNFTSLELLSHESSTLLSHFDNEVALEIGQKAVAKGLANNMPIAISIRLGHWQVFKASLPGSTIENDGWIDRKANVVNLTHHSTMYERVSSEEEGVDWHQIKGVEDSTHAIHGGGFPIATLDGGYQAVLVISGLPQVEDHLLALEIMKEIRESQSVTLEDDH
jgi:uncharacterized protein (UPF0303 family)